MLITDIFIVERWGQPAPMLKMGVELAGALLVVAAGKWLAARRRRNRPADGEPASTS
jgi:predicted acetyltransferase